MRYEDRLSHLQVYGVIDEAGNWIATDKDGKPLPPPRDDRIAVALESIAASLEKIANPLRAPLPAWTFPHELHVQADSGVRESGPIDA